MSTEALANARQLVRELGEAPTGQVVAPTMGRLKRISYTHDALIDLIIEQPGMDQNHLAAHFGYTASWISNILASDAFKARLAARREEIIDPEIRATVKERMEALLVRSVTVLMTKLENSQVSDNLALRAAELGAKSLGLGVAAPPAAPDTGVDRLANLAERLITLQSRVRQGVTYDGQGQIFEAESSPVPQEGGGLPAQQGSGPEPGAGESAEGAVRADRAGASETALQDGRGV